MAALGALVMTTLFLAVLVWFFVRIARWVKAAGFRFKDFEAHQSQEGVELNTAFARAEFADVMKPRALPAVTVQEQVETHIPVEVEEGTFLEVTADDDFVRGDRLAVGDKPNHVRLATATETEVGFAPHRVRKGERFMLRILQPSEQLEQMQ